MPAPARLARAAVLVLGAALLTPGIAHADDSDRSPAGVAPAGRLPAAATPASWAVTDTIELPDHPIDVAVSTNGNAYVTTGLTDSILVLDLATQLPTDNIVTEVPIFAEAGPPGRFVYFTSGARSGVQAIDTEAGNTITMIYDDERLAIGDVAVSGDGSKLYVTASNGSVVVLDSTSHAVIDTIPTMGSPTGISVSPAGERLYVADVRAGVVEALDATSHESLATFPLDNGNAGLATSGDGKFLYVSNSNSSGGNGDAVKVIDTATFEVVQTIPVESTAAGLGSSPDGTQVYAAHPASYSVSVIAYTPAVEPTQRCQGREVTTDGLTGTSGDDVILGTPGDDVIDGRGGNDVICAAGGDDTITSGPGADRIQGGPGNDTVAGTAGNDVVRGGPGRDTVSGGTGTDRVHGGRGADRLSGGKGRDTLVGYGGPDRLSGGAQGDRLDGGSHEDRCFGGTGKDTARDCEHTGGIP